MRTSEMSGIVSGAFVFWDAGTTQRQIIYDKLEALGLGQFAPLPRSPNESLQRALLDYGERLIAARPKTSGDEKVRYKALVQPRLSMDKNGLELVIVTKRSGPNEYETPVCCRVDSLTESCELVDGYAPMGVIQESYNAYRRECSGSQVGSSLVSLLKHFHSTCVRQAGGLYYLPQEFVGEWTAVCDAFESSSKENVIHAAKIVMDERAARSVRSAINDELVKAAGQIVEEMKQGFTEKGVETRRYRAQAIREKAERYQAILGDSLQEIMAVLSIAEQVTAANEAVESAFEEDIFV